VQLLKAVRADAVQGFDFGFGEFGKLFEIGDAGAGQRALVILAPVTRSVLSTFPWLTCARTILTVMLTVSPTQISAVPRLLLACMK